MKIMKKCKSHVRANVASSYEVNIANLSSMMCVMCVMCVMSLQTLVLLQFWWYSGGRWTTRQPEHHTSRVTRHTSHEKIPPQTYRRKSALWKFVAKNDKIETTKTVQMQRRQRGRRCIKIARNVHVYVCAYDRLTWWEQADWDPWKNRRYTAVLFIEKLGRKIYHLTFMACILERKMTLHRSFC